MDDARTYLSFSDLFPSQLWVGATFAFSYQIDPKRLQQGITNCYRAGQFYAAGTTSEADKAFCMLDTRTDTQQAVCCVSTHTHTHTTLTTIQRKCLMAALLCPCHQSQSTGQSVGAGCIRLLRADTASVPQGDLARSHTSQQKGVKSSSLTCQASMLSSTSQTLAQATPCCLPSLLSCGRT